MTTTENNLPTLADLDDVFAFIPTDINAISLTGEEQSKYLQGQVTCDVNLLKEKPLLTGAHCNAKGKVYSVFRLFEHDQHYLLLQPQSTITDSLKALQKFAVFAKVDIKQHDDIAYLVIAGKEAANTVSTLLTTETDQIVPDVASPVIRKQLDHSSVTIIYLDGPVPRYLVVSDTKNINKIISELSCPMYPSQLWRLLEITSGFPVLNSIHSEEYVPQMLNLQAIDGISFTKGCYLGQETVARMQYLGKNKRALFVLSGENISVQAGDIVEQQLGENWRKAGEVINYYQASNGKTYLQAVLSNDINEITTLRIKGNINNLTLVTLHYRLNDEN